MTAILTLREISAGYGATVVLDRISLSIDTGTTLAVLGRNGVGKTTLLATILGHTTLHDGSVTFSGHPITNLKPFRRARLGIGWVPQEREIFPSLTVEENLTVAARGVDRIAARGVDRIAATNATTVTARDTEAVNRSGANRSTASGPPRWTLARVYDLFPNLAARRRGMGDQLSGGEQQMLAIARALMGNPSLLLLDEPLEGLAPVIVDRLLAALRALRSQSDLTLILTEQHARLALEFSDHAVILDRGRIVHAAPAAALLADPGLLSALIGVARH